MFLEPCPSMSNVDLFFLLESNPNMGYENWKNVLKFVEDVSNIYFNKISCKIIQM